MIRFVFPGPAGDYLDRVSRLRWRREFGRAAADLDGVLEVADPMAIPLPGAAASVAAAAARGREVYPVDSAGEREASWTPPDVQTLRELEASAGAADGDAIRELARTPVRWAARFVPARRTPGAPVAACGFRVLRAARDFPARPEIVARIPREVSRLLDVGCGSGETGAAAAAANPGLAVEGIDRREIDSPARARLSAFHSGDARCVMREMAARGERFDGFLFADVLEHVEDPFALLEAARAIAKPEAALVVSVPNAASAAIVGDLIAGRFDPVPSGPEDAGHLRWFTRASLIELLEESGCRAIAVSPGPGRASGRIAEQIASVGIACDPAELSTLQWIATARFAV